MGIISILKEFTKKSTPLLSFLLIFGVGIVVALNSNVLQSKDIYSANFWWNLYGVLDTSSAVAVAFLAFFGYINYIKLEDKIKIYFLIKETNKKIDLNISILRKNFTRSELMGILGMIRKDSTQPFDISYLKQTSILDKIHNIQKGNSKEFIILVTQNELENFNLNQ